MSSSIAAYYNTLIAQHGHDPKACDYGHPASQQLKFNVLEQAFPASATSVLDVGCGFADFANFLNAKRPSLAYTGMDITSGMVEKAQALHPSLPILHGNILEMDMQAASFDIVTANGIFYLIPETPWQVMQQLIARMFTLAKQAVVFNTLSTWAPTQEATEFYADPGTVLAFCRTLTPWVALRHDYHPRDFTVSLYKTQQPVCA